LEVNTVVHSPENDDRLRRSIQKKKEKDIQRVDRKVLEGREEGEKRGVTEKKGQEAQIQVNW